MVKLSASNERDLDLTPGLGRSPGEGNGNPHQYSYLENSMDGGYNPWGLKESDMTEQLHFHRNISCKDGHNKGQKWYGPNRSRRC